MLQQAHLRSLLRLKLLPVYLSCFSGILDPFGFLDTRLALIDLVFDRLEALHPDRNHLPVGFGLAGLHCLPTSSIYHLV